MSSYERYDATRRRNVAARPGRSTFAYWIPLALTVTIATAGLVAWIWSERDSSDDDDEHKKRETEESARRADSAEEGFVARMSGAINRTQSPQQFFDSAGRLASAAGAAVGLGGNQRNKRVVRGEREEGFSDHERWSEEATTQRPEEQVTTERSRGKERAKRTVAVVLSAERKIYPTDSEQHFQTEHASILSHLPERINTNTTNLFVLIYAPQLTSLPGPHIDEFSQSSDPSFSALQNEAISLVPRPEMVLPFTTPTGYVHILRHLAPETVYISDQAALVGDEGRQINDLRGWVGQVVVVVGDDGTGGLADTETETEGETDIEDGQRRRRRDKTEREWWERSEMVGLGKGVEIVDIRRMREDWMRRLGS